MTEVRPRKNLAIILAVLFIVGVAAGARWYFYGQFIESTDNAYVEAEMAVISPRVAGYVAAVLIDNNDAVIAGQPLLKLDNQQYVARLNQAQALLAASQARLETLASQVNLQRALINEAEANLKSALAEQQRANIDSVRYADLVNDRAASRQQLESAIAIAEQADAKVQANRAAVSAREGELAVFHARKIEIQSQLQEAEANLTLARIDLENTVIRAPIDGVIGNRHVQLGQYLQPGNAILRVVPIQDVFVTANFKETQVAQMQVGQTVELSVDAFSSSPFTGIIESFSPAAGSRFSLLPPENATGNFTKIVQRIPVRIRVAKQSSSAGQLRPGMSVVVTVDTRDIPVQVVTKSTSVTQSERAL